MLSLGKSQTIFDESYRVLKSNGTLAYWFYKDPVFIGYPEANKVYTNYTYNSSLMRAPMKSLRGIWDHTINNQVMII